jgi:hypothetical protein
LFLGHVKLQLCVFSKSTRIVISSGFGISKRFEEWIGHEHTIDDGIGKDTGIVCRGWSTLDRCNMVHGNFDRFGFPSTTFTRNKNGLISSTKGQAFVTKRRNFIDMRLDELSDICFTVVFPNEFVGVFGTDFFRVNFLEPLKGVDGNDNISRTCVRVTV